MNSKTVKILFTLVISCGLIMFNSCTSDDNPEPSTGNATLQIKMGDSPAGYDEVNVEILKLNANINGTWHEFLLDSSGVYNLLEFTNGNTLLLLGPTPADAGSMSELRLILGENNSIVVDGITCELKTPSGQSSGYKVKMETIPLVHGVTYSLVLDFDVNSSVHPTGNDKYMLKPVVRGYLETAIGKLSGIISPVDGAYYVKVTNAIDTAGTYIDLTNGHFLVGTLNPGTYNVHFDANSGYLDKDIFPVDIVAGQTTDLGTIVIDPTAF